GNISLFPGAVLLLDASKSNVPQTTGVQLDDRVGFARDGAPPHQAIGILARRHFRVSPIRSYPDRIEPTGFRSSGMEKTRSELLRGPGDTRYLRSRRRRDTP